MPTESPAQAVHMRVLWMGMAPAIYSMRVGTLLEGLYLSSCTHAPPRSYDYAAAIKNRCMVPSRSEPLWVSST